MTPEEWLVALAANAVKAENPHLEYCTLKCLALLRQKDEGWQRAENELAMEQSKRQSVEAEVRQKDEALAALRKEIAYLQEGKFEDLQAALKEQSHATTEERLRGDHHVKIAQKLQALLASRTDALKTLVAELREKGHQASDRSEHLVAGAHHYDADEIDALLGGYQQTVDTEEGRTT